MSDKLSWPVAAVVMALISAGLAGELLQTYEELRQEEIRHADELAACDAEVNKLTAQLEVESADAVVALRSAGACHAQLSEAAATIKALREGWSECTGVPRGKAP